MRTDPTLPLNYIHTTQPLLSVPQLCVRFCVRDAYS